MEVHLKRIHGNFTTGYALDKHTTSSTPTGYNEQGHMQFHNVRSPAGEALYQLKYKQDFSQIEPLAQAVVQHIVPLLTQFSMVVPMPPSRWRPRQPVVELASAIGVKLQLPSFDSLLTKVQSGPSLKDLPAHEKAAALHGTITLNRYLTGQGPWNALLVDDLFDSGATVNEACRVLRTYEKIGEIYIATFTWK